MGEPKKELTEHERSLLRLRLMLDGIKYQDMFGRAEFVIPEPDAKQKASRSWKGSVRVVGKGE